MPYRDTGKRPWFCDKPECRKDVWGNVREHSKYHQKTCTLRFPNGTRVRIERDKGGGWYCPKCNHLFEGSPRGIRAIHTHAKSGDCLRASPMADSEAAAMEHPPELEVLEGPIRAVDDTYRETMHDDLADTGPSAPPEFDDSMAISMDAPRDPTTSQPIEVNIIARELSEKLNITQGTTAMDAKCETSRVKGIFPAQNDASGSTANKKVPKDEFPCKPTKPPLITLDTFLDGLRLTDDRLTKIASLRRIMEKHNFSTPRKLDDLFRNPPDFRLTSTDPTMQAYQNTVARDIVEQVSLSAWSAVRAGILARAKELGVQFDYY